MQFRYNCPVGHPLVYMGDEACQSIFENEILHCNDNPPLGFLKASILPPRNIFIQVLPCKINNKLLFTLCRMCAIAKNNNEHCEHEKNDRSIRGIW